MNYSHTELTSSIIEAAIEVQRALGGGFSKDVFKRALATELGREGIDAEVDSVVPLYYKGDEVGERKVDIWVEGLVYVELDTNAQYRVPELESAMQHLRALRLGAGLLLNFGPCKLDYVRMHMQGCRTDILIGDSIQHLPERKHAFTLNGGSKKNGVMRDHKRADWKHRWVPLWLRGKRLQ